MTRDDAIGVTFKVEQEIFLAAYAYQQECVCLIVRWMSNILFRLNPLSIATVTVANPAARRSQCSGEYENQSNEPATTPRSSTIPAFRRKDTDRVERRSITFT